MRLDEVWFPMDSCAIAPKSLLSHVHPGILPAHSNPQLSHPSGRASSNTHWAWPRGQLLQVLMASALDTTLHCKRLLRHPLQFSPLLRH